MPLMQFQDGTNSGQPQRIGIFRAYALVHVQVVGAGQLRIASQRDVLQNPIQGNAQGITFTQGDGLKSLWWLGEMWAIGSGPCNANIEVMDKGGVPLQ